MTWAPSSNSHDSTTWLNPERLRLLRLVAILLCLGALGAGGFTHWFKSNYYVGLVAQDEKCLPWSAILVVRKPPDAIRKGDLVEFIGHNIGHGFDGRRIVKMVAATEGDHIRITNGRLYINGRYWDDLWLSEKLGVPVSNFDADYLVPKDMVFLLGTSPRSFDSRYWGPRRVSEIIGYGIPLF